MDDADQALRSARARAAALARWARIPPAQRSRDRAAGFRRQFENQVDPDRALPTHEREALIDTAIRAHNARANLAKLRKRRQREDAR